MTSTANIPILWAELQIALAVEDHRAIAHLDRELNFALRGEAIAAAKVANAKADYRAARKFLRWAESGIPRNERQRFMEAIV